MKLVSQTYRNCQNCGHIQTIMVMVYKIDGKDTLTVPYVCSQCHNEERRQLAKLEEAGQD